MRNFLDKHRENLMYNSVPPLPKIVLFMK